MDYKKFAELERKEKETKRNRLVLEGVLTLIMDMVVWILATVGGFFAFFGLSRLYVLNTTDESIIFSINIPILVSMGFIALGIIMYSLTFKNEITEIEKKYELKLKKLNKSD